MTPAKEPSSWAGDISGGLASAVVAVTGNVAAGVIAFAPLGPEYAGQAILAGMFTSVIGGLLASLLGRTPGMILGPKVTTAMVFAALMSHLVAAGRFDLSVPEEARVVLTLAFMAVLVSGTAQLALGAFRVGRVVTFIPHTVIGGIRNAAALLLILSQVWPFLGISQGPLWQLPFRLGETQVATLVVATFTALLIWRGGRIMPKAIVAAAALAAGAVLHQLILLLPGDPAVGPLLGPLPSAFPTPRFAAEIVSVITSPEMISLLPVVLVGGLAIAVLDSITSLISLVAFQSVVERRFDANRHLLGMGVGNVAVAFFGGLSASGIFARSAVNHKAGGRTRWSGVANALWVLLLLLLLAVPIGFIPKAALAGLIVVVAFELFDRWSLELLREAVDRSRKRRQDLWTNLLEMLLVVAVGLAFNLIAAVGAGVGVAILTFVVRMSRSPIRRVRRGSTVRSKLRRDEGLTELLQQNGDRIAVVELEGTVFFGSSDSVARSVEDLAQGSVSYLVIDLKRVRRIDASGYKVLGQTYRRLKKKGVRLAFTDLEAGGDPELREGLLLTGGVDEEACLPSTDHALERFENSLLSELGADPAARDRWTVENFAASLGLSPPEHERFARALEERVYSEGEEVCALGDPGHSVYFLASGSADVTIPIEERGRSRRLATLTRGTIFGEMSLVDGRPRSADVRAREPLVCYELTTEAFHALADRHPETAVRIYQAVGRILGERLREANEMIHDLDV